MCIYKYILQCTLYYIVYYTISYYIYLDTDITMNIRDSWCELQDTEMPRIKSLTFASCFGQGGPVADLGPGQTLHEKGDLS